MGVRKAIKPGDWQMTTYFQSACPKCGTKAGDIPQTYRSAYCFKCGWKLGPHVGEGTSTIGPSLAIGFARFWPWAKFFFWVSVGVIFVRFLWLLR
jgi:hypothetical protein